MSRKTIGENPLDSLLGTGASETNEAAPSTKGEKINGAKPPKASSTSKKAQAGSKIGTEEFNGAKQRLTVQLSQSILERAKNAVYWTRGLTLAQLTEQALEKALAKLEKDSVIFDERTGDQMKSKGEPFPERREELKSGRPVK